MRRIGPPLLNDFIALQKDVALIAIIGVTGEAFRTAQIETSSHSTTPLVAAALLYLCITIPMARFSTGGSGGRRRADARPVLEIRGVTKAFGELEVLRGIDLTVHEHEAVALIGASFRQVHPPPLRRPARGRRRRRHPARRRGDHRSLGGHRGVRRRLGLVFQAYNLFPHLSALDNIGLGLVQGHGMPRGEAEGALALLDRFGLEGREHDRPDRLSGGQQQRVAIARAFGTRPRAMLLDEVTSALDPELVGDVLRAIRDLKAEGVTMLLATHEMGFAREVADRVGFLHEGRLLEVGPPDELLSNPREPETSASCAGCSRAGRAYYSASSGSAGRRARRECGGPSAGSRSRPSDSARSASSAR